MRTLNLGILAHVDAGKTSLTERLLFAAGVIDAIGSVDNGNTQTDTLALERQRGITIKAAVVSFVIDDVCVNLIDTPGHPDFIAEVERVLNVLDGAVLVISAVEGVQAQTRILMRTLQRLRIPTLIFINKIDRSGAQVERVLRTIAQRLTQAVAPMGLVRDEGTHAADFCPFSAIDPVFLTGLAEALAENDEAILAAYVESEAQVPYGRLRAGLAAQSRAGLLHPLFMGSAITGAGVDCLLRAIPELLPSAQGDEEGPVSGTVFKIERGGAGEKIAYVRMFSGTLSTRDRLRFGVDREGKVTALSVFDRGSAQQNGSVSAGRIGKLWGLADIRIGDAIGVRRSSGEPHHFAPPTLETVIVPCHPAERPALHAALTQLAEQDPLINLRQDDVRKEIFISLYGEVQKEVIQQTLAADFGIDVEFRASTMICIERPVGIGEAIELAPDPFAATVGLRVEPAPVNSGVQFRLAVEFGSLPLAFHKAIEDAVHDTLRQGLYGWQVTDCIVTMTQGIRLRDFAQSTAADHRNLTPLVLMAALRQAGSEVCEPVHRLEMEVPADTLRVVLPALVRLGGIPEPPVTRASTCTLAGEIAAGRVHDLQRLFPSLSRGEGVLETAFDHYRPVNGTFPIRPRSDNNPLNRKEYLRRVQGRRPQG